MIPVPGGVRVWLATGVMDMRRGMHTLALRIQEDFGRDPHPGDFFIFRGPSGDLVTCSAVDAAIALSECSRSLFTSSAGSDRVAQRQTTLC